MTSSQRGSHRRVVVNEHWVNLWTHEMRSLVGVVFFSSVFYGGLFIHLLSLRARLLRTKSLTPTGNGLVLDQHLKWWFLQSLDQIILVPKLQHCLIWLLATTNAVCSSSWRWPVCRFRYYLFVKLLIEWVLESDVTSFSLFSLSSSLLSIYLYVFGYIRLLFKRLKLKLL